MRYWKVNYYTAEGDFETKSFIITDEQHELIKKAIKDGAEFIAIEGKPTIKRTLLGTIIEADKEVLEYQQEGLKVNGLLEPAEQPKLTGKVVSGKERIGDYLKRTEKSFKQKMGWK